MPKLKKKNSFDREILCSMWIILSYCLCEELLFCLPDNYDTQAQYLIFFSIFRFGLKTEEPNVDNSRKHKKGNPNLQHRRNLNLLHHHHHLLFTVNRQLFLVPSPTAAWILGLQYGVQPQSHKLTISWILTAVCNHVEVIQCRTHSQHHILIKIMDIPHITEAWTIWIICSYQSWQIKWITLVLQTETRSDHTVLCPHKVMRDQ